MSDASRVRLPTLQEWISTMEFEVHIFFKSVLVILHASLTSIFISCSFLPTVAKLTTQQISRCAITNYTVHSLIKLHVTATSRFPAGTSWLTAKRYMVFPIRIQVSLHKTIKSTSLSFVSSSCRERRSDSCVKLYQRTHCTFLYFLKYLSKNVSYGSSES
jgi:hypothetical protein